MSEFADLPPFPNNLPVVPLKIISLVKLLEADSMEDKKLFEASKSLGFFYLDLRNASQRHDTLLSDADRLFELAPQFFAISEEEKEKYDLTKNNGHG